MNLYQTVQYILSVAKAQPNVSYAAEGDIYQIMNYKDDSPKYSAVVVSQSTHAESGEWRGYNFEIFYIDRLTADQSNRLQVQNIAIEVLSNIAKVLVESGFEIQGEIRYHTFDEKFEDLCAGAYMEIVLQSEESLCADGELPYIPGGEFEPSFFNPADYYTSAQTDERIEIEIEKAQFSGKTLEDYWTSAQTQTAINNAVSGISVSGVTKEELDEAIAAETARTEATYLKEHQSLDNYYTKSETDDKIAEAFSAATASGVTRQELNDAIAAETARTEQTYLKEHQSLDNYYTKTEVDSAITEAISEIDLSDYYTSGQTDSAIAIAVQDKVESQSITEIWTGSQVQYDAMTGHSANILYIINS